MGEADQPEIAGAAWQAAGRSALGALHARHGLPNQDAFALRPAAGSAPSVVMAVADGHGAAVHYRSGIGAHIAVAAAVEILAARVADPGWMRFADRRAVREAGVAVIAEWRRQAAAHLAADPPGPDRPQFVGAPRLVAYGTTLIAAAATPEGVCLLQVGDGDALVVCKDGTVLRPLPDDRGLVGEATYSLCQDDAEAYLRVAVLRPPEAEVDFMLLASDGLGKSFADPRAMLDLVADWRRLVHQSGLDSVTEGLDSWLSATSQEGSGDDTTLVMAVRGPAGAAGDRMGETAYPRRPLLQRAAQFAPPRLHSSARLVVAALVSALGAAALSAAAYLMLAE